MATAIPIHTDVFFFLRLEWEIGTFVYDVTLIAL